MTCNKCLESRSGRGDCGNEQKCTNVETRCLAIRWGTNQIGKKSNSYDTRCATADECSDYGISQLCSGNDCEAKCCQTSKCNPFGHHQVMLCTHATISNYFLVLLAISTLNDCKKNASGTER